MNKNEFLTVAQVAELLGFHSLTIRRAIRAGSIPASRIPGGRQYRIFREDLRALRVKGSARKGGTS